MLGHGVAGIERDEAQAGLSAPNTASMLSMEFSSSTAAFAGLQAQAAQRMATRLLRAPSRHGCSCVAEHHRRPVAELGGGPADQAAGNGSSAAGRIGCGHVGPQDEAGRFRWPACVIGICGHMSFRLLTI